MSTFTGGGDGQGMRSGRGAGPAGDGVATGGCCADDEAAEGVGVERPLVMTGWLAAGVAEDVR